MSKRTSSFGVKLKGTFSLFKNEEGFIQVVDIETLEAAGTLVAKDCGALYHMMIPLALHYQEKFDLDKPTPDEVSEVYKRVVKKLGLSLRDAVKEAVLEVLDVPAYSPEDPWDYTKVVPPSGTGMLVYPEDEPLTQEDEEDEEDETHTSRDDDL